MWKPRKDKPELAGELLLATRPNGDMFVQFQKTPFTVATAQVAGENWFIEFGSGARRWSGRGEPSQRLVWFHLPHLLKGEAVRGWNVQNLAENSWRVENPRTGESLEGSFLP